MEILTIIIVLTLITLDTGFTLYLGWLNHNNRHQEIPEIISDVYNQEEYLKFQNYHMDNFKETWKYQLINFIIIIVLLATKAFVVVNDLIAQLSDKIIIQTLLIILFYYLIGFIVSLFQNYYKTFKIEEKYGFNKMTKKLFIIDQIKKFFFTLLLVGGLAYLILDVYLSASPYFFLYVWGILVAVIILVNLLYTKIIVPIFNKLRPLEDSSLKTKINEFANKIGYEISKISVMDASKRSTKLNAFFSGFGKTKRIVLFDTLIEKMTEEEIVAVLAHEIGHNKHKHIIFNLFQTIILLSVYVLGAMFFLGFNLLSEAFGFTTINYGFNLIIYFALLSPVLLFLNLLLSYISRKFEYQADRFAADNYDDEQIISALKVLSRENFSNLTPHPLFVKFYYSHPPLLDRINNIKNHKKDEI